MTPPKLGSKEFEEALLDSAKRTPGVHMVRYGVQATIGKDKQTRTVQSLPDFDGAVDGRQFVIEAKVCAGPSFELRPDKLKPRQVSHMVARSKVGVPCWLVIHFTERRLVRVHEPAETIAIPVSWEDPRWQRFVDAAAVAKKLKATMQPQGSISRQEASRIGQKVAWTAPKGTRKPLPDLATLLGIHHQPELL